MGCFSKPKTEFVTPIDPAAKGGIYNPLVSQVGSQLFGTPERSTTTYSPGLAGLFERIRGQGVTTTTPATSGAFTGAAADWVYPGQRVAPTSPLQQQNFDWASMLPGQTAGFQNLASQATDRAAQPMNYDALMNQSQNLWNRTIMPSILNQQGGMDQAGGGGTTDALSRAGVDLSTNLMAQIAPLELQARNQQLQAASQYSNIANMPLNAMQSLYTLGGEQRGIGQQQLSGQQQVWNEQQPWNHPLMQSIYPTLSAGQQTAVQQPGGMGYSMATSAAGGLGQGLGMLFGSMI